MILGGLLGIMFVTILRRVMVEDPGLPFPESVAAGEIHKAGQKGAEAALQLFRAMGVGAVVRFLDGLGHLPGFERLRRQDRQAEAELRAAGPHRGLRRRSPTGGITSFSAPAVTPAYLGVGYIIGPGAGRAELRRRPAGVGPVRAAARLLRRADDDRPATLAAERRQRSGRLGGHRRPPVPLHRPADRGRRHAGRRVLHALQDAEEPDPRRQARHRRRQEVGRGRRRHRADPAGPVAARWSASGSPSSSR